MYTIKAFVDGKEYMIHNPRVKVLTVGDPYFEIGDNVNGQAEFTVYPTHPYYKHVKKLTTDIVFYNNGVEEFSGRVLYDDETFNGTKKVFVEGEMAFFCDSIQRPKVYHNTSVRDYLADILSIHNSQVEQRKQFVLGRVSVTDQNDSLYRYSNWESTRTVLKEKLTDRLGGHLVIRKQDGIKILDYLSDEEYYHENAQIIRFGKNLLDYSKNMDASDLATCIIPLGARQEESSIEGLEERLTISSVNGGVDYVTDDAAVAEYGRIYQTVIWDDVTVPENLMRKGVEYLSSAQFERMVLTCRAIDMNLTDEEVEQLTLGSRVRCISEPNGMDRWFPVSSKKVYIADYSKNSITLGTEQSVKTYTASQRKSTAGIEEEIRNMPSKEEVLQAALRDATDLMNRLTQSGHAIHNPNEFIVSDTLGIENAKMLWRWGLGGLAHYSNGYNGSVDGVALTMDGKINGKMLIADSVTAASIDIGYRESVEKSIENAELLANEYSDDKLKLAKEEIESSIKNTADQITLSVTSVREAVMRKNYVVNGEQETLALSAFNFSGTALYQYATTEFLNMKSIMLTFTESGTISITQDLGTLEEGTYNISVTVAYPEGYTKRPSYVQYGFSGNHTTTYLSGYAQDKYHILSRTINITKSNKTVSVNVYGTAGTVCYLTNIRCLRDMDALVEDLRTELNVEVGKIQASVSEVYESVQADYCECGGFTGNVADYWFFNSQTLVKTAYYQGRNCLCIDLTGQTSAIYYARTKNTLDIAKAGPFKIRFKAVCSGASTARVKAVFLGQTMQTQVNEINTSWKTVELNFTAGYAMSSYAYLYNGTPGCCVYITDVEILGNIIGYARSNFTVLKDRITSEVSKKVGNNEIISAINQSAEKISIKASKIALEGIVTANSNFKILSDGSMQAKNGKFTGRIVGSEILTAESGRRAVLDTSSALKGYDGATIYNILDMLSAGNNRQMTLDGKNQITIRTPSLAVINKSFGTGSGSAYETKTGSYTYVSHVEKNYSGCTEMWVGSVYCTLPVFLSVQKSSFNTVLGMVTSNQMVSTERV